MNISHILSNCTLHNVCIWVIVEMEEDFFTVIIYFQFCCWSNFVTLCNQPLYQQQLVNQPQQLVNQSQQLVNQTHQLVNQPQQLVNQQQQQLINLQHHQYLTHQQYQQ